MIAKILEEIAKEKAILLDNSFMNPQESYNSINRFYHYNPCYPFEDFQKIANRRLERAEQNKKILLLPATKVISETIEEVLGHKQRLRTTIGRWEAAIRIGSSNYHPAVHVFEGYSEKLNSAIKLMHNRDPRNSFSTDEWALYETTFDVFKEIWLRIKKEKETRRRHPCKIKNTLGDKLMTDPQICATLYVMSGKIPVLGLTSDWDIYKIFSYSYKEEPSIRRNMAHPISLFGLSLRFASGKGFARPLKLNHESLEYGLMAYPLIDHAQNSRKIRPIYMSPSSTVQLQPS
ncbi:MAG: hypothetical protein Q7S74_05565 [Nanoarchaeota archaeon]|nr:hypothetical protein [Nanoarchaeota archaeon]